MRFDKQLAYILLVLIIIYFAQGVLYAQGSLLSQGSLFLIFAVSIYAFIKTILTKKKMQLFFKIWTLLLILNVVNYILTADLSSSLQFGKFKGILLIALPFYPFYYFSSNNVLKDKHMMWLFLTVLPIVILQYYLNRTNVLLTRSFGSDNIVNNISYMFVYLIPYLFLFKRKKLIPLIGAMILIFFIIQGAKRGALIAGIVGFVWFGYYQFKTIDKKNKARSYLIAIIAIVIIVLYGYNYYIENEYLINRMASISEGQYSGRDIIYANIFNAWWNSDSYYNLIYGFGFGSSLVLSKTGNWAHNDWLEGLAGMGIIGVVAYLFLFLSLGKIILQKSLNSQSRITLLCITSIWLITTLVSMNYYNSTNSLFQFILLGYMLGSKSLYSESK